MAIRRKRLFEDLDDLFPDFDKIEDMMDEMLRDMQSGAFKQVKPGEPLVYGVNIRIGPDGKPVINQFGNVTPKGVKEEREPLVDVIAEKKHVRVVVELPGVEKDQIRLTVQPDNLRIAVNNPQRKFSKQIRLPAPVREESAKATYKNGILEVLLERAEPVKEEKGKSVTIH